MLLKLAKSQWWASWKTCEKENPKFPERAGFVLHPCSVAQQSLKIWVAQSQVSGLFGISYSSHLVTAPHHSQWGTTGNVREQTRWSKRAELRHCCWVFLNALAFGKHLCKGPCTLPNPLRSFPHHHSHLPELRKAMMESLVVTPTGLPSAASVTVLTPEVSLRSLSPCQLQLASSERLTLVKGQGEKRKTATVCILFL